MNKRVNKYMNEWIAQKLLEHKKGNYYYYSFNI